MQKSSSFHRYLNRVGWIFIIPAILFFGFFMIYPIGSSLLMVTQRWRGISREFIGFGNFIRMAQDQIFWKALGHNFLFMIIQIPLMVFLALTTAVIVHHGIKRWKGSFRTIFFLPCVTSLVAYSVIFRVLLQTNGLLNNMLIDIGILSNPVGWLNNPLWAKVTIILALTWRWTGYNMVFFLVGLQNINNEIFEAAEVDGASKIRQFFSLTLPLLVPVILFSVVTSTSGTMQLFDEPNILTWDGGPANATMTVALYIYRQAFVLNSDFGYASAMSYVMVMVAGILAYVQVKVLKERS